MKELEPTDINGSKKAWERMKRAEIKKGLIFGLSKHNSEIAIANLKDFENGVNTSTKGMRAPASLIRIRRIYRVLSKRCKDKDIDKLSQEEISKILKKENSEHFARNIKVIYKWMLRTHRIKEDPTAHISPAQFSNGKPAWVYLGEEGIKLLINSLGSKYRALTSLLFDSGMRPEEAWRIRVLDFQEDFTILDIPEKRDNGERVAKKNSFGRKIKLKMCPTLVKEYIAIEGLKTTDLLFNMTQAGYNKALRVACIKLFGKKIKKTNSIYETICEPTKARESPAKITAYDIRHNAACFWLKRYKTNKDLMYRFGWKKEDKVFYYTEFLDMRDTIDDEDLITPEDKTKMEKEMEEQNKRIEKLETALENSTKASFYFLELAEKDPLQFQKMIKDLKAGKKP